MTFIQEFQDCGYFYQATNLAKLTSITNKEKICAYIGFDCTARSLHVGNLMQIMILRLLQKHGHKPIILVGGATTRIGDPTGKDEMRKVLSEEDLTENIAGIKKSLSKFIEFGNGPSDAIMVNNADWFDDIGYIEFLSNYGRLFSVNRMMSMDSVRLRLERQQPLTFLEFNYMLLQAYDFHHLNKTYNCRLQLGGSDQWGNIIGGIDLVHKISRGEVFGLTTPLLTTNSGAKMGKSVNGAIWINEEELSPYDYFQYWRNIEDADIIKFAKLYCEFNEEEIATLTKLAIDNINEAKKQLAYKVTLLCHGQDNANKALETAIKTFEQGTIAENLPTIFITQSEIKNGVSYIELMIKSGLVTSKGEARRLIKGNGAKLNEEKVSDEELIITYDSFKNDIIKLSSGKKNHALVKIESTPTNN